MKKVGLVLGGGGARGLAHLGILRVLEREKIPIHCIAGTSMGAIIGACYAVTPDAFLVEQKVRQALGSSLFARMKFNVLKEEKGLIRKNLLQKAQDFLRYGYIHLVEETKFSLFSTEKLQQIIDLLLPDIDVRETKVPFACVAADLTNCREKIFMRGSLRLAVLASASIPGVFPPVFMDGIYYNDGGAVSVTPVRAGRELGGRFIIAVDVKSKPRNWEKPVKAKEIVDRSNYITGILLNECQLKDADAVIAPAVKEIHWHEFDRFDAIDAAGKEAAEAAVKMIKLKLSAATLKEILAGWVGSMRTWFGRETSAPKTPENTSL